MFYLYLWTYGFLPCRFGLLKIGTILIQAPSTFCCKFGIFASFTQNTNYSLPYPCIGSLKVAHLYILTRTCLIFLLKRWLRWSSVGKMKTHTYITHVAKSKIGSNEIIAPFFLTDSLSSFFWFVLLWYAIFSLIFCHTSLVHHLILSSSLWVMLL